MFKNLALIIPNLTVAVDKECERTHAHAAHVHPNTTISVVLCSDDNLKYKAGIAFVHKINLIASLSLPKTFVVYTFSALHDLLGLI